MPAEAKKPIERQTLVGAAHQHLPAKKRGENYVNSHEVRPWVCYTFGKWFVARVFRANAGNGITLHKRWEPRQRKKKTQPLAYNWALDICQHFPQHRPSVRHPLAKVTTKKSRKLRQLTKCRFTCSAYLLLHESHGKAQPNLDAAMQCIILIKEVCGSSCLWASQRQQQMRGVYYREAVRGSW